MKLRLFAGLLILVSATISVSARTECAGPDILKSPSCAGDEVAGEENALIRLVNEYRAANGLRPVPVSGPMAKLANRHLLDIAANIGSLTHGWSDCPYDMKSASTWGCVFDAPRRLNIGYIGIGFENIYRNHNGPATPTAALEAWKKSPMHNALILNKDVWNGVVFDAFGVAIRDGYAALWFGSQSDASRHGNSDDKGLGITFEQAVSGLADRLSIEKESSVGGSEKWVGTSADKLVRLDLFGREDAIAETTMALSIKLPKNGALTPELKKILLTFLGNVAPDWDDREKWLDAALMRLGKLPRSMQSTRTTNRAIALRNNSDGTMTLEVKPYVKPVALEF